jgi:hypothetical protein
MHHLQGERLLERVEIAIAVEEGMVVFEAIGRNETVDGLANGPAPSAQRSVVGGGGHSQVDTAGLEDLEAYQAAQHPRGLGVCGESLQHLTEHDIEHAETLTCALALEPLDFGCADRYSGKATEAPVEEKRVLC